MRVVESRVRAAGCNGEGVGEEATSERERQYVLISQVARHTVRMKQAIYSILHVVRLPCFRSLLKCNISPEGRRRTEFFQLIHSPKWHTKCSCASLGATKVNPLFNWHVRVALMTKLGFESGTKLYTFFFLLLSVILKYSRNCI